MVKNSRLGKSPKTRPGKQIRPAERHPVFGALKGLVRIPPGVDLTEPADPDPMTDAGALREGYATVTPLRIDANDRDRLRVIEGWGLR